MNWQYNAAIIGSGKGGKTLAAALAKEGKKVFLAERSERMYGGSCPNKACLPTKLLLLLSRLTAEAGGDFPVKARRYADAVDEKERFTLNQAKSNKDRLIRAGVSVRTGEASFLDPHTLQVKTDSSSEQITVENIFICTGSKPVLPDVPGLAESRFTYTSETLLNNRELPEHLLILGGGYIGVEFAGNNFGSDVTVLQDGHAFLPREDSDIAQAVAARMQEKGIEIRTGVRLLSVGEENGRAILTLDTAKGTETISADAILVATGRRPNGDALKLENAGIGLNERGGVRTDTHLRTDAENIYALGDVTGGLQFTHISLDDCRIVQSRLRGNGERTTENRGVIPYCTFFDPSFSRVGMTEDEARRLGYEVRVFRVPASVVPKLLVFGLGRPVGLLKAVVDAKTDRLLGVHLFFEESHEAIHLAKLAMESNAPYQSLQNAVFSHPTVCEAYNYLFE